MTYGPECFGKWEDKNGNGEIDQGECNLFAFSGTPGSGSVTTTRTGVSQSQSYVVGLRARSTVTVSLTGMSRDFDCRGRAGSSLDGSGGTPAPTRSVSGSWRCSDRRGAADDSWSGSLDAGTHTLTVSPYGGRTAGGYTLSVAIVESLIPEPPPLSLPAVSNLQSSSGGSLDTVLPAATGGTTPYVYSVSGLPSGITFAASTRRASGTLPAVTTDTDYTITYTVTDSTGGASVTFVVAVAAPTAPSAPVLSGSVSGRTQTLTWIAPGGGGITRYQLQTRASAAHAWRFSGTGAPSPSSNIGASVRSWSLLTPWTLVRQYQVRATNGVGDGAWSNVVELTTPPAPPPPLSVPAIPNFRLPSGGSVNTVFPAATGGTAPYSYSVSGLPPGITFAASTRRASGTLPTVTTDTDYAITYTAMDSASGSSSVTFTATVTAPAKPAAMSLTGSVVRQTQSLSWSPPTSSIPITKYELQLRNSANHGWRHTTAGSPSPSSAIAATATGWSVTGPAGLVRHYRIRAWNASGAGGWSSIVILESDS